MAKTLDEAGVKRLIQEIKGANKNLNTPIPISMDNTTESMAQNVKNIADYVEKAKAAGIADVNGMAVTCLIDNDYSGVGYLYAPNGGSTLVTGIITYDDTAASPTAFFVDNEGLYAKREVVIKESSDQVTSDMLVEGARKPIIITGDMTEVDEETYQKLSQEGTDVILSSGDGTFLELQGIFNTGDTLNLIFGYSQFDESSQGVIAAYTILINTSAPHTLTAVLGSCDPVSKNTLSSVLQEIDLTGTDAERKAKLDQFETDWKTLTGADDLTGARFIGRNSIPDDGTVITGVLSYDDGGDYVGLLYASGYTPYKAEVTIDGSITITPLFSHLEAITIYTDNTPEHMQANLDNIAAYEANLQALGVDTDNNHIIPIKFYEVDDELGESFPFGGFITTYGGYEGFVTSTFNGGYMPRHILISQEDDGGEVYLDELAYEKQLSDYTLKKPNAKSLGAITIKTDNSPASKAANVAAIKAYVDNLKALGVDVTKGYTVSVRFSDNGYIGICTGAKSSRLNGIRPLDLVSSKFVVIETDGTYKDVTIYTSGQNISSLSTTSKQIVGAINEVNALAKGYSTIFTPIELTTETAHNKTAIDARVAAFTAQGISLTNGCCIPVTYKGVYAGNISLINGDWYGLLVKNTNNPADNINIKLSADGTITEGNSAQ